MTKLGKKIILDEVEEYIFKLLENIERREPTSEKIYYLTQSLINVKNLKEKNND